MRSSLSLSAFVSACLMVSSFAGPRLVVSPSHTSGVYRSEETVSWSVATVDDKDANDPTDLAFTLKADGATLLKEGTLDAGVAAKTIEVVGGAPKMLLLEVTSRSKPDFKKRFGAAVAPEKIGPVVERPADFDSFWAQQIEASAKVPLNPVVTPGESGVAGVEYYTVRLDNIHGAHVYGQLAKPARAGKFPAVLRMQWAGGPYPLEKGWVTGRAAEGYLILNVMPHDVPGDRPKEFYEALPQLLKDYIRINDDERDRNYFLSMYIGDYRAAEYLTGREDWDGRVLVANGTSMGGQQTLALAGLHPKVTHAIAHEPAGADALAALHGRAASYPFWDLWREGVKVKETAPYFDTVNFAPRIHAKALVSAGWIDYVCTPTGIWTAFNLIPAEKEFVALTIADHTHLSTPEQLKPFEEREAEWFAEILAGKR